ncbi:MAG: alpha/beta fold hydrolase [Verrucomicrobiales bacterium]|nr:alpha/beta fold hydrolase [Verrucomicrobiales bacterium]
MTAPALLRSRAGFDRHRLRLAALLSILLLATGWFSLVNAAESTPESAAAPRDGLGGTWTGTLKAGAADLPLVFQFSPTGGGNFTGTLTSTAQSPLPLPFSQISLRDREVKASIDSLGGRFEGKIAANGRVIRGEWTQGGHTLPLDLAYQPGGAPEPRRPQTPRPPHPYRSEAVTFAPPGADHRLSGTLTLPEGPTGRVPGIVLISGSGPQDRDETIFGHKPFAVIADHLTRQGIAVLRYDDRGTGASTGTFEYATTLDFADDAAAAAAHLASRPEIDPARVGLLGHSEGGLIAPIVAARHPDRIACLVLLAGPGLRGDEILLTQTRALLTATGQKAALIDLTERFQRALFAVLTQPAPDVNKAREIAATFQAEIAALSPDDAKALAQAAPAIEESMKALQTPWFARFLVLDPGDSLRQLSQTPLLALFGERDLQVLPEPNLAALRRHLEAAGNTRFTAEIRPGLNHLFQKATTGLPTEYSQIETTIEPAVLQRIAGWIAEAVR